MAGKNDAPWWQTLWLLLAFGSFVILVGKAPISQWGQINDPVGLVCLWILLISGVAFVISILMWLANRSTEKAAEEAARRRTEEDLQEAREEASRLREELRLVRTGRSGREH